MPVEKQYIVKQMVKNILRKHVYRTVGLAIGVRWGGERTKKKMNSHIQNNKENKQSPNLNVKRCQ